MCVCVCVCVSVCVCVFHIYQFKKPKYPSEKLTRRSAIKTPLLDKYTTIPIFTSKDTHLNKDSHLNKGSTSYYNVHSYRN